MLLFKEITEMTKWANSITEKTGVANDGTVSEDKLEVCYKMDHEEINVEIVNNYAKVIVGVVKYELTEKGWLKGSPADLDKGTDKRIKFLKSYKPGETFFLENALADPALTEAVLNLFPKRRDRNGLRLDMMADLAELMDTIDKRDGISPEDIIQVSNWADYISEKTGIKGTGIISFYKIELQFENDAETVRVKLFYDEYDGEVSVFIRKYSSSNMYLGCCPTVEEEKTMTVERLRIYEWNNYDKESNFKNALTDPNLAKDVIDLVSTLRKEA